MAWRLSAWVLKAVAALCLVVAIFMVVTPDGSDRWPTVEARVLSTRFAGVISPFDAKSMRAPTVLGRYRVDYAYTVGGAHYTGTHIASDRPRDHVRVYVDPTDPLSSVIEPGVDVAIVVGSLAIAGTAYAFSRMARSAGG